MMTQVLNAQPTQTKLCYLELGWSCVVFSKLAGVCHSIYPCIVQITKKTFVSKGLFTCLFFKYRYTLFSLFLVGVFPPLAFLQGHHYAFMCYIWNPQSEEFLCIHCPPEHTHSVLMAQSLSKNVACFSGLHAPYVHFNTSFILLL